MSEEAPRLSLCMIAKNEERFLEGCLESAQGVVDEIILVDTGSSDATVSIAQRFGARVSHFPWIDDFSAARNASLEQARGRWVLVLDADERLAPGSAEALRDALDEDDFDLGLLPLVNAGSLDVSTAEVMENESARKGSQFLASRLMRRGPSLRYEGRVHENTARWALDRPAKVVPAFIVHYGEIPSLRASLSKNDRNRSLLELECQESPERPQPFVYLGLMSLRSGERARAAALAEQAFDIYCHSELVRELKLSGVGAASLWGHLLLQEGRAEEAFQVYTEPLRRGEAHPNLWLGEAAAAQHLRLEAEEQRERDRWAQRAREAAQRCLRARGRLFAQELVEGGTSWSPGMLCLEDALIQGDVAAAGGWLTQLRSWHPEPASLRFPEAERLLLLGRGEEAFAVLGEESCLEAWVLRAEIAELLGDQETMRVCQRQAFGLLREGQRGSLRMQERLKSSAWRSALYHGGLPDHCPASMERLDALLRHRPCQPDALLLPPGILGRVLTLLLRRQLWAPLLTLLSPRARGLLPEHGVALQRASQAAGLQIELQPEPRPVVLPPQLREALAPLVDDPRFWVFPHCCDHAEALEQVLQECASRSERCFVLSQVPPLPAQRARWPRLRSVAFGTEHCLELSGGTETALLHEQLLAWIDEMTPRDRGLRHG